MQLTEKAWDDVVKARLPYYDIPFKDPNAFDPIINREFGEIYLKDILPRFLIAKKIPLTLDNLLASYNWGAGNVSRVRYNKSKYPKETQDYIRDISKELREVLKRKKLIDSL